MTDVFDKILDGVPVIVTQIGAVFNNPLDGTPDADLGGITNAIDGGAAHPVGFATASGALAQTHAALGDAVGFAVVTADPGIIDVAGDAVGFAEASAEANVDANALGDAIGFATATGVLSNAPISGNAIGFAEASAIPSILLGLAGDAVGHSQAEGTLLYDFETLVPIEGAAAGLAEATGSIITIIIVPISGSAVGAATAAAELTVTNCPPAGCTPSANIPIICDRGHLLVHKEDKVCTKTVQPPSYTMVVTNPEGNDFL